MISIFKTSFTSSSLSYPLILSLLPSTACKRRQSPSSSELLDGATQDLDAGSRPVELVVGART